ncbi:phytosulfokine precursor protein [Medicago truncatula]|uniref:Phytosulfokine n=1 Tax=Medicago truncatula TaxID=3880 RepID=A0A072VLD9_MEDTR|nr:phytosulfokine precursor protein [Medicago truncatula]
MNKVSMQYVTLHFNLSPCVFNKVEIGFLGPNTKIEVSGDSFVLDLEGDESLKMLGMEKCNIEDEDCMQRRMTLEAHLDYIYTQHHKP